MSVYLDRVFLELWHVPSSGMPVLEWAFRHFDKDRTKFILTNHLRCFTDAFKDAAKTKYLPRCAEEKFRAEILMTGATEQIEASNELITIHGLNKYVISKTWISEITAAFKAAPRFSCKVWYLDNGKLDEVRYYFRGRFDELSVADEENSSRLKKLQQTEPKIDVQEIDRLKEGTSQREEKTNQREKVQKEWHSMTEQANVQEIDHFRQEIERLNRRLEEETNGRDKAEKELLSVTEQVKIKAQENAQEIDRLRREIDQHKEEARRSNEETTRLKKIEKQLQDYRKPQSEHALRSNFTVEDLKQATKNFKDLLGKGAYGSVYKGYLRGTNVAIKILNDCGTQGVAGFKQEVAILTTCRHPNLVTLMGVCYESSALIYEFLPNGSLEDHLCGMNNTTLTWQVRTRIICEICIALNFLHSNRPNMIIHGDLKPDNILLDANFRIKLGDFGISRIIDRSGTNTTLYHSTINPSGTFLYMDPEFAHTGKLTEKSDVFSFGVIILRLLTGKVVQGVVYGVMQAMEDETLDKIIDVSAENWPFDQAKELAELALRCVEMRRIDRPNLFNEIWPTLERLQRNI